MNKSIYTAQQTVLRSLLKEVRLEAHLRQVDLAERLDEPQSFVSKYEAGERRLDLIELRHVCEAIGIPLRVLVDRFERGLNETER